jgi:RNA polymerase sigma factor (sigma-70 family)
MKSHLSRTSRVLKLAFKKNGIAGDDELISGCLTEDRTAQNQLFSRFAPKMLGVCYRYVQTVTEAEDIMQDGFVKVFDNLKLFRKESSLETWITRIMVNASINHLRATKKFKMETDLELVQETDESATYQLHHMDTEVLMKTIRQLPEGYRLVLNLFAIEGYSHKEIADHLGITESTSRSQFSRARQVLKQKISGLYTEGQHYAKR